MFQRVGSATEIETTAARDVSSGDLHEAGDGRAGVYLGSQDVASGNALTLHVCERGTVVAAAFAATSAGDLANFNFTTQTLVASGGTNVGEYTKDKALNATSAEILLNSPGESS